MASGGQTNPAKRKTQIKVLSPMQKLPDGMIGLPVEELVQGISPSRTGLLNTEAESYM